MPFELPYGYVCAVSPGAPPSAARAAGPALTVTRRVHVPRFPSNVTVHCTAHIQRYTAQHIHIHIYIYSWRSPSAHIHRHISVLEISQCTAQRRLPHNARAVSEIWRPPAHVNAVCAHSSFSRLAVKSHHVEVAGTGHKSSCTHRSRFAGGLRSLADSRPEKASYYPRQQNTSLFQSVHPRSALVAQCRLRWFVNPACREANC